MVDRTRVLVADDEPLMRKNLEMRLRGLGYDVELAGDGDQAAQLIGEFRPHVVLSDIFMPGLSGMDLLKALRRDRPDLPVVLMTSLGTVDMAVEAMNLGANNFLTKPLDPKKLKSVLEAAVREPQRSAPSPQPVRRVQAKSDDKGFGDFVGRSKAMQEVYKMIQAVAPKNVSVLVTGESGTGKELAARAIHQLSERSSGAFVAVNSAAIPKDLLESEIFGHEKGAFTGAVGTRQGCFELASGGTLLLDELAEMPMSLQPKLLRVLEDGRVRRLGGSRVYDTDVRVVAATNRPPTQAIREGLLREDLYYRLNVFSLELPPLRRRLDDLELMIEHFVERFNIKHGQQIEGVDAEALEMMCRYRWPGNVRELRNVIERAVILTSGSRIEVAQLPSEVGRDESSPVGRIELPEGITAAEAERHLILQTLERTGNNKAEAARQLGLDVKTIRNKLKTYGLV